MANTVSDAAHRDPVSVCGRESAMAAGVAVLISSIYIGIAALHGALGVSRNDDWTYYRSAFLLARSGVFSPEWSSAMLIGQAQLARPIIGMFGPEFTPLQILVAAMGAVALWGSYLLCRALLPPLMAAVCVLMLALGPMFGTLATSFMTDVPAFSLQVVTLLVGLASVRGPRVRLPLHIAALAFGLMAFSVREFAIAAPLAVAVAAQWLERDEPIRRRLLVALPTMVLGSCCLVLYAWRIEVPGWVHVVAESSLGRRSETGLSLVITLALFILPATLAVSPARIGQRLRLRPGLALGSLAVSVGAWLALLIARPFEQGTLLGNYLTPWGSYPSTLSGSPIQVLGVGLWLLLHIAALWSLLITVLVVVSAWSGSPDLKANSAVASGRRIVAPPGRQPACVLLGSYVILVLAALLAALLLLDAPVFDRAVISVIPFAAALLLRSALDQGVLRTHAATAMVCSLAALSVLGLGIVDSSATFDGAKWALAQRVEDLGVPAQSIDGGFEWFGFHQPGPMTPERPISPGSSWWTALFAEGQVCATSSSTPQTAGGPKPPIAQVSARSLLRIEFRLSAHFGPDECTAG